MIESNRTWIAALISNSKNQKKKIKKMKEHTHIHNASINASGAC